jgi:uncharacterized protein (DUF4415 family)
VSAKRTAKQSRIAETPQQGRADVRRLRAVREPEIMKTSPEELADLPEDFWDEAELIVPVAKRAISLRVDEDVLEWFRALGPRYQTRMNAVLRTYMSRTAGGPRRRRTRRGQARHDVAARRTGARDARSGR